MDISALLYVGIIVVLALLPIDIYLYKHRFLKRNCTINTKEYNKFINATTSIQPINKRIFNDKKFNELIKDGFEQIKQENYRMLDGVNINVL